MARAATSPAVDARRGAYVLAGGLACLVAYWLLRPYAAPPDHLPAWAQRLGSFGIAPAMSSTSIPPADTLPVRPSIRGFAVVANPAAAGVVLDAVVDAPHLTAAKVYDAPDGSPVGCAPIALGSFAIAVGKLPLVDLPHASAFIDADGRVLVDRSARIALVADLRAAAGTVPSGRGATTYRPGIVDAFAALGFDAVIRSGVCVDAIARAELPAGRPLMIAVCGQAYGRHGVLVTGVGHDAGGRPVLRIALGWPGYAPAYLRLEPEDQPIDETSGNWIEYAVPASPVSLPQSPG